MRYLKPYKLFENNNATIEIINKINNCSEKEQIDIVTKTPVSDVKHHDGGSYTIKFINNPTKEVQLAAVKRIVWTIGSIENPDKEVQLAAVKQDGFAIQYIKNPDKEVQLAAVNQFGKAIRFIENPNKEVQLAAINNNVYAIEQIKNPDKDIQLAAVNRNGSVIQYIENPNKEVQLAAVKQDGSAIQYIENPDKEVQLAAVKKYWRNIEYIKNPDISVVLLSYGIKITEDEKLDYNRTSSLQIYNKILTIPNHLDILSKIKKEYPDIYNELIKHKQYLIKFPNEDPTFRYYSGDEILRSLGVDIKSIESLNKNKDVQLKAVKEYASLAIQVIKNPDKDVQLAAVKADAKAIDFIENPDISVILYVNGVDIADMKDLDYKQIYNKILTIPNHLDILFKIKQEYPTIYKELIKHGNKYTDRYVGTDLDDMLSFKK